MPFENIQSQGVLTVTTTARPKRVVFFVDPERVTHEQVNALIKFSVRCWGGRRYPIIPCAGGTLDPEWWKLLKVVDPDVIYSLVPLSRTLIDRINRQVLPAKIVLIGGEHASTWRGVDLWRIGALDTTEIPKHLWARRGVHREPRFYCVQDSVTTAGDYSFVLRNFGVISNDASAAGMFRDLPVVLVNTSDIGAERVLQWLFPPHSTDLSVLPVDLAGLWAPPGFERDHDARTHRFHLVVGDHPWDAILAWNLGLHERLGHGRSVLWISVELARSEPVLSEVAAWISREYLPDPQHRNGVVVSSSVDSDELAAVARRLLATTHMAFESARFAHGAVPYSGAYDHPRAARDDWFGTEAASSVAEQVALAENKAFVRFRRPPFLTSHRGQFGWMVDAVIQYRPERYFYTNVRPHWTVPKRLGVSDLFFAGPKSRATRIVAGGLPSIEVMPSDEAIEIEIPPDSTVLWRCCKGSEYPDAERQHPGYPSQFEDLATSEAGRYLNGILQMFGSLYYVSQLLDDPFWRRIVFDLAGWDASERTLDGRKARVLTKLADKLSHLGVPVGPGSEHLPSIAAEIANTLTFREPNTAAFTLDQIKGRFSSIRGQALKLNPTSNYWNAYDRFDEIKLTDLEIFRRRQIFIQGVELRCPNCFTTLWHTVENFRASMQCDGCASRFAFPTAPEWRLRLNGLLANAIRRQGTLSVLQALCEIDSRRFGAMFLFLPCQDLYRKAPTLNGNDGPLGCPAGAQFTDLDLLYIRDSRLGLGEVKSSPGAFTPDDFEKLKVVALDFRPDDVVIAAAGTNWPPDVQQQIAAFSDDLGREGIRVVSMLLQWPDD